MKENDLYAPIKNDLRALPQAVVIKHADRFTRDIPDFEVLVPGGACWGEIKYIPRGRTLADVVKTKQSNQILFCHQLAQVCNGRAWVLIYEEQPEGFDERRVTVWQPKILYAKRWPNVAGPMYAELGTDPVDVERHAPGVNLVAALHSAGVISVCWGHDVLRQLITHSFPAANR